MTAKAALDASIARQKLNTFRQMALQKLMIFSVVAF